MDVLIIKDIKKEEFLKIKEEDVLFITNPGRMGDEDGSTFIVKDGDKYSIYRINGWMYGKEGKDYISFEDALDQFPKWKESLENSRNEKYEGKYKYLYMGFGNGLCIDNRVYEEYKSYLDETVKEYLDSCDEKEGLKYAAIFNTWDDAFINMVNDKGYVLKQ